MGLFNFKKTVLEIFDIVEYQIKAKNLYLREEISSTVPVKINTDQKRIKQVLLNLIQNAIKFTFKGGITVRASLVNQCPNSANS